MEKIEERIEIYCKDCDDKNCCRKDHEQRIKGFFIIEGEPIRA